MRIEEPEPTKEDLDEFDGSSLPFGAPTLIGWIWGWEQLIILKEEGNFHDNLVKLYPNNLFYCRLLFYIRLDKKGIRRSLIFAVSLFLAPYDWSPKWLKKFFKKLVPRKK